MGRFNTESWANILIGIDPGMTLAINARTALRIAAHLLNETAAINDQRRSYQDLRKLISVTVRPVFPTGDVRRLCESLHSLERDVVGTMPSKARECLQAALDAAAYKENDIEPNIARSTAITIRECLSEYYPHGIPEGGAHQFEGDFLLVTSVTNPREIFERKLFQNRDVNSLTSFKGKQNPFSQSESVYDFWQDWYQGFLEGDPLDWELQLEVAMIDNEIWATDPKTVANEIEKIRARHNLQKRIKQLEAELRRATVNRHGIGGNLPPEPLDDVALAQELIIVWQPLEELKDEITADEPDDLRP